MSEGAMLKKASTKKTTVKKTKKTGTTKKKSGKILVLVESPAKAKTIEKYLGTRYIVRASMGHLRDLPKSQFAIDIEHDFEPKYINIRGKGDLIKSLKKEAQNASKVYLASDPDREGEAIAWHLAHILDIAPESPCRIVFNEITKYAISEAVKNPRAIDLNQVDAQQARRLLDRIVGYQLSPFLWRKVRKGLSAGRVQSVAVRLICDREREIQAFESVEYWTIDTKLKKQKGSQFSAELTQIDGQKASISSKQEADAIVRDLEKQTFSINNIKKSERRRKPAPPFTTSSLQQDAAHKLGFTSRKTMMLAQQLYEGISMGAKGAVGLITYMRTDSTRVSDFAQEEAKKYLLESFGEEYVPDKPNIYTSNKKAQDAHEAVRPTQIALTPAMAEKHLNRDQLRLYTLIWQRFIASQMTPAVYNQVAVDIRSGRYMLRASGSQLKFAGFTAIYVGAEQNKREKDVVLPELSVGDNLSLMKIEPQQHFTEPPPRYNDATIVKALEEKGIGRPSTYAPTIDTIQVRGYVVRKNKCFQPTELGFLVEDMLEEHFRDIVDVAFTADLETNLDNIADGKVDKTELLREFYTPFSEMIAKADEAIGHLEIPDEVSDVPCDVCGRMMVVKQGRYGKFLACPGFPECRNTKAIIKDSGEKCPKCGGSLIERRSRRGSVFYGCANYPECDYLTWDIPQKEKCKECGSLVLLHRYKNGRAIRYCSNDDCKTRIDHPINKELDRIREKAQKAKENGADSNEVNK